jgi:hypothetical protein
MQKLSIDRPTAEAKLHRVNGVLNEIFNAIP